MLKYFNCPAKVKIPIAECLEHCIRKEGRCLSLPTLHEIGKVRKYTQPTTTMLLPGIRQTYLQITKDYAVDPMDTAFMLLGTRHHQKLEIVAKKLEMISEERLTVDISGTIDLLEPDELAPDFYKLIDYKTWGSYAVKRALGRNKEGIADMRDAELQLNNYRLQWEKIGFPISRMLIQACVRDGGTFSARHNGVPEKFILIPVTKLDDEDVYYYFHDKRSLLLKHLENKTLPEMCEYEETWGSKRCHSFCPVAEFCPEGAKMNKIEMRKDTDDK